MHFKRKSLSNRMRATGVMDTMLTSDDIFTRTQTPFELPHGN